MSDESPLQFPCEFPIKIVGENTDKFELAILTIINKHFDDITETAISTRLSSNEKYLSITVTVNAKSQAQLDAAYIELSGHELVVFAL